MGRVKFPSDLGPMLKLARELKGWSLLELSAKSGVGYGIISQVETGRIKEPSFRIVVKLCRALHLPIERVENTVGD